MKPKAIAHRVEELPDAHLGLGVSSSDQAHMSAAFFWAKMILHARRTGRAGSWLHQDMRWSEVSASCIGHALPCPRGPSSPTRFLRARRQHRLRPDQTVDHDLLYLVGR